MLIAEGRKMHYKLHSQFCHYNVTIKNVIQVEGLAIYKIRFHSLFVFRKIIYQVNNIAVIFFYFICSLVTFDLASGNVLPPSGIVFKIGIFVIFFFIYIYANAVDSGR